MKKQRTKIGNQNKHARKQLCHKNISKKAKHM